VDALAERCRTAFLLCREQEMAHAEGAEIMGVSPATVKTQMGRAPATIRSAILPILFLVLTAAPLIC
jgi:DNA-directed RNA polymerase specialized sigma24 family protein